MFARMQVMSAFLVAGAFIFNSGCQSVAGAQKAGAQPQQSPSGANESETPVDIVPARIEARTYLAAARLHESQNRPLQAIQQYEYALIEDPGNALILNRMGMLYDQAGNSAAAEKAYKQALQHEPNNPLIHNNLAFSYILRQRWTEAESELFSAIALAPEFSRARINLGMVLAQTSRFDDALRQFQMVLPPDEAQYNIGLMYQSKRKSVEAAASYKRALQANPKLVAAQEQLKRLPSDVLGAADRKLQEEQQAALAAAEAQKAPASQPAVEMADLPTVPVILDGWPDDYLQGMMADALEWIPGKVRELTASIQARMPATQPALEQVATNDQPACVDAAIASELDALFPAWQRSPELIENLKDLSLVSMVDDTSKWLDCQASPLNVPIEAPDQVAGWQPVAQSDNPE